MQVPETEYFGRKEVKVGKTLRPMDIYSVPDNLDTVIYLGISRFAYNPTMAMLTREGDNFSAR